jgi:hypothetical protein
VVEWISHLIFHLKILQNGIETSIWLNASDSLIWWSGYVSGLFQLESKG